MHDGTLRIMSAPETPETPETPVFSRRSVARVATDRPDRYGRQLAAHMSRKITTAWDDASATGSLACDDGALVLTLRTTEADLARLEQVTGIHLARFGHKEGLAVIWVHDDGTPGTTQGPLSEEDMVRMRAEREARRG